jgi:hypothetical protein
MSSDNFCILVLVAIIVFMLYMMNKSGPEGFEDSSKGLSTSDVVKNIIDAKNTASVSDDLVDKVATKLVEATTKNTSTIPAPQPNVKSAPVDIFKEEPNVNIGVPAPNGRASTAGMPLTDAMDNTRLSTLNSNRTMLTSDQLLPNDNDVNDHNMYKIDAAYIDTNLAFNGYDKLGVDTIGSSRKRASTDIRGNVPCPKIGGISPWLNSSGEPDGNLVGFARH